ncbi:MAG: DMT family transporter [Planctomycetaceae bacterium]|nr:DMT family transporter [Planctomycetaceae bacterium]
MNESPPPQNARHLGLEPALFGLLLALISAALYAVTNVCLRSSVGHNDIWVTCLKTAPTAFLAAGLLWFERRRRASWGITPQVILLLAVTGVISQWCGNVAFQIGLRKIGLAIGPPITFGMLMVSGAILSRVWLRESITPLAALGIATLIGSIALLQFGANASTPVPQSSEIAAVAWTNVLEGVGAVCLAGFSYALLGSSIRWATMQRVPPNFSVMIVGLTGLLTLGFASWWQLGFDGLLATPLNEFAVMVTAGVCNTLAFLFLAWSLELAPVSQVNAVNSSQVAMSSIAGVLLFHEPGTWQLAVGILLMVAGLWLINRREKVRSS